MGHLFGFLSSFSVHYGRAHRNPQLAPVELMVGRPHLCGIHQRGRTETGGRAGVYGSWKRRCRKQNGREYPRHLLLAFQEQVVDVFGGPNIVVGRSNTPWAQENGWAVRRSGTGPDSGGFVPQSWTYSGTAAVASVRSNAVARGAIFPSGTYVPRCGVSRGPCSTPPPPPKAAVCM